MRSRYGHGGLRHARGKGRRGAGQGARGTARAGRCDTAAGAAIRQGASARTQQGLPTIRPGVRAPGRASAHLGVPAGPAGCLCIRLSFQPGFSTLYFS